jgi:hypothetical protein
MIGTIYNTIKSMPFDAEVSMTYIKNLMEKPLGPNENVMTLVTNYVNQLKERETELSSIQSQISEVKGQIVL